MSDPLRRKKSIFSYYGSKSKIAHRYPDPRHDAIIEPFAGSAAYSFRHRSKNVFINDIDERTASIWEFLFQPDSRTWIEKLPRSIKEGDNVSDTVPDNSPIGLIELVRAEFGRGSFGMKNIRKRATKLAAYPGRWGAVVDSTLQIISEISHWTFTRSSYEKMDNRLGTWFVDPPYNNEAGDRYSAGSSGIDYQHLSEWCMSRQGDVIVCENEGADWLPFQKIAPPQGCRPTTNRSSEAVCLISDGKIVERFE